MRIALAQINPTVGDIEGNARRILAEIETAESHGADLVVFPELAVFGYPPKDLVLRMDLVLKNEEAIRHIASHCRKTVAIVGFVEPDPQRTGKGIFNSAAICRDGRVEAAYAKMLLPTYDVFDESRYFNPGRQVRAFRASAAADNPVVGLTICEDLWNDHQFEGRRVYGIDPIVLTVQAGARILINLSASPFRAGVQQERESIFAEQVREHGTPLVYLNQVGGNDDLVFDGASMVMDAQGRVIARNKAFEEDFQVVDLGGDGTKARRHEGKKSENRDRQIAEMRLEPYPDRIDCIRRALVLGLRDYVHKCGFQDVVLGLSGGIDSAVTAVLAVEALGAAHVQGVAMPSRFSSDHSIEDAQQLAENLGIDLSVIPIEPIHRAFEQALAPQFKDRVPDVTEENIQARIRGNLLMGLSNKFGRLLLTTGNKSELAVGYCTLYGDMCGGVAVLSDVPKTIVYELARRINAEPRTQTVADPCLVTPSRQTGKTVPPSRGDHRGANYSGARHDLTTTTVRNDSNTVPPSRGDHRGVLTPGGQGQAGSTNPHPTLSLSKGEGLPERSLIPLRTIEKPPSAELRENQRDQDTLPPYDILDAVLERYVERRMSPDDIVAEGFDRVIVESIARKVDANEYKRKQAPVGLKVTSVAFGTGRRMPIAAKFQP